MALLSIGDNISPQFELAEESVEKPLRKRLTNKYVLKVFKGNRVLKKIRVIARAQGRAFSYF